MKCVLVHVLISICLFPVDAIQTDSSQIPEAAKAEHVGSIAKLSGDIALRSKQILEIAASILETCDDPAYLRRAQGCVKKMSKCENLMKRSFFSLDLFTLINGNCL